MKRGKNKGQVTIFIIIAIAIFAILLVVFYPRIKVIFTPTEPVTYVEECIAPDIENIINTVSSQGGSTKPSLYLAFEGSNIEYLCYTSQYYRTCTMQQPMLKQHIEREIDDYLETKARSCVQGLQSEMQRRGYNVNMQYKGVDVQLVPNKVNVIINANVVLTKDSATQSFDKFDVSQSSQMYDLVMISTDILNLEARYGDSESTTYMIYYPNIRVEKLEQGDGSKVYILTDKATQDKFTFATRSLAWPGGFKL